MIHHLLSTLERLESLLDEAIDGMRQQNSLNHAAIASAKGRALLALTRLTGDVAPDALNDEVKERIRRVRAKLQDEQSLLERRLEASQLVVGIIADAVLSQDWDGTYGPVPLHGQSGGRVAQ